MINIQVIDIIMAFSSAIDLISPQVANHQKRVAYIAYALSSQMKLPDEEKMNIVLASLLHDCGALDYDEKISAFKFDNFTRPFERHAHGYKGWLLMKSSHELACAAEIVKFHHIFWNERNEAYMSKYDIPLGSYIIHLADRIDAMINNKDEILKQKHHIIPKITEDSGSVYMPDAVEAFLELSKKEYFWFDIVSPYIETFLKKLEFNSIQVVDEERLISLARVIHQIIDFRSPFTATHSVGVAECARLLSARFNMDKVDNDLMYAAGMMHDLGKLSIPSQILEKSGPLTKDEFYIMKKHTFHSYRILENIPGLERANRWISFHHEKLDGEGYPFCITDAGIDLGSRIMTVSDIFTALTEDRPYRKAMSINNAIQTMKQMAGNRHIDMEVLEVLMMNIDEIDYHRIIAQKTAMDRHILFNTTKIIE